jgi:hypothetical protein
VKAFLFHKGKYTVNLIDKLKMRNSKLVSTPTSLGEKLVKHDGKKEVDPTV